jgi:hypothetical protein
LITFGAVEEEAIEKLSGHKFACNVVRFWKSRRRLPIHQGISPMPFQEFLKVNLWSVKIHLKSSNRDYCFSSRAAEQAFKMLP